MARYTIKRDGLRDLSFDGTLLTEVSSRFGSPQEGGTLIELRLYKTTVRGTFLCERVINSQWVTDGSIHEAKQCRTVEEVVAFFGCDWLSKSLYTRAEIDTSEPIDWDDD